MQNVFFTNQKELADGIGITAAFYTRVKKREKRAGESVIKAWACLTGIKPHVLYNADSSTISRIMKKFFEEERAAKSYTWRTK